MSVKKLLAKREGHHRLIADTLDKVDRCTGRSECHCMTHLEEVAESIKTVKVINEDILDHLHVDKIADEVYKARVYVSETEIRAHSLTKAVSTHIPVDQAMQLTSNQVGYYN